MDSIRNTIVDDQTQLIPLRDWDDISIYRLLKLLRSNILQYIYAWDNSFLQHAQKELPHYTITTITKAIRTLMERFALALKNKQLKNEVIEIIRHDKSKECIYIHQYLYEITSNLLENQSNSGGIWHPDELSCFLRKIKQYGKDYNMQIEERPSTINESNSTTSSNTIEEKNRTFFTRIQIWGKSIADCRAKFNVFHKIYIHKKCTKKDKRRHNVEHLRYMVLQHLFYDILSGPMEKEPKKVFVLNSGAKLWSLEEKEKLVHALLEITKEVNETGSSLLVKKLASNMNRSFGSLMAKLNEMRRRVLDGDASGIPALLRDPTTDAYQLFQANWNDKNEPWSAGIHAFRSHTKYLTKCKNLQELDQPKIVFSQTPLKTTTSHAQYTTTKYYTQKRNVVVQKSHIATWKMPNTSEDSIARTTSNFSKYSPFVLMVANTMNWTDDIAHSFCIAISTNLSLYQELRYSEFYKALSNTFEEVQTNQNILSKVEAVWYGRSILKLFTNEYGKNSIWKFDEIVLNVNTAESTEKSQEMEDYNTYIYSGDENDNDTWETKADHTVVSTKVSPCSDDQIDGYSSHYEKHSASVSYLPSSEETNRAFTSGKQHNVEEKVQLMHRCTCSSRQSIDIPVTGKNDQGKIMGTNSRILSEDDDTHDEESKKVVGSWVDGAVKCLDTYILELQQKQANLNKRMIERKKRKEREDFALFKVQHKIKRDEKTTKI